MGKTDSECTEIESFIHQTITTVSEQINNVKFQKINNLKKAQETWT